MSPSAIDEPARLKGYPVGFHWIFHTVSQLPTPTSQAALDAGLLPAFQMCGGKPLPGDQSLLVMDTLPECRGGFHAP